MPARSDGSDAVTQTVILAAGTGTRLGGAGATVPKPLVHVAAMPLVAHALAHAGASGCSSAVIVVGHEGARVRAAVEAIRSPLTITFVETPDPTAPNGHSLLAAAPLVAPRFFLQMVDHLFGAIVLPQLVAEAWRPDEIGRVLVDRAPIGLDLADATRVRLDGRRVTAIGKQVDPWDAIDAGCFVLTRGIFDALAAVGPAEPRTVSSAMRRLVANGALSAVDVDGTRWVDVDTPRDRDDAERLLLETAAAGDLRAAIRP